MSKLNRRGVLAASAAASLFPGALRAQAWPGKPIRWVVPYTAGGLTDVVTRLTLEKMNVGQNFVVDNKPGANSLIGAEMVANAAPDGYTFLTVIAAHAANKTLYAGKLKFDPVKGFAPISLVAVAPLIITVTNDLPVKTVGELIAYAKKNPGKLSFGSSGVGAAAHLTSELMKQVAGIDMVHVPYKGSAPALQDVIAGNCQVTFDGAAKPFIDSGKVRFLGTTSARRDPRFPDFPTIGEGGLPGYDLTYWLALFGPAGLPAEVEAKLNAAANVALAEEGVRKRLTEMGVVPTGGGAEILPALIRAETDHLRKIAVEAKLQFQ